MAALEMCRRYLSPMDASLWGDSKAEFLQKQGGARENGGLGKMSSASICPWTHRSGFCTLPSFFNFVQGSVFIVSRVSGYWLVDVVVYGGSCGDVVVLCWSVVLDVVMMLSSS